MSKYDEPFRPEQVDEQIEALVYSEERSAPSNARLVSQLHQMYDEESEIVAQVWARLSRQAAQQRKENVEREHRQSTSFHVLHTEQVKGPQPMKSNRVENQQRRRRLRFFEMCAAILIMAVLVGGMVLALKIKQSSLLAGKSTATPTVTRTATSTPGPVASSQAGIYASTQQEIEHIDLQSGKTTGHFKSGFSSTPVIANGVIYFNEVVPANGSISNSSIFYIDAVNVTTGKQLWRKEYRFGTLLADNGIVYDGSCSNNVDAISCSIVGINASNGRQLWSYPTPQGSSWITAQNGVVYGVSSSQYFALNGTTGVPIWQKTLPGNEQANMTPLVSNGTLYFSADGDIKLDNTALYLSSEHNMQPTSGLSYSYFFAFNAASGREIWHKPLPNTAMFSQPTATNGTVYIQTIDGNLSALNATNGSTIWTYQTGGASGEPVLVNNGTIYMSVNTSTPNTARLLALDATTGTLKWSKNQTFGSSGAQASTNNPLASATTSRVATGPEDQTFGGGETQALTSNPVHPLTATTPAHPFSGGGSGLDAPITFALDTGTGLIYVLINSHTVSAFQADTGILVRSYAIAPASIDGFVLVTRD